MRSKWCACAAVRQLIKAGYSNWWNEKTSIILSRKIAGAPGVRRLPPHTRHRPIVAHLADARPEQPRLFRLVGGCCGIGRGRLLGAHSSIVGLPRDGGRHTAPHPCRGTAQRSPADAARHSSSGEAVPSEYPRRCSSAEAGVAEAAVLASLGDAALAVVPNGRCFVLRSCRSSDGRQAAGRTASTSHCRGIA